MPVCPVCNMPVSADRSEFSSKYQGTTYLFHTLDEKEQFDASPDTWMWHEAR